MNGRELYLADVKNHENGFYVEGSYGGLYLQFTQEWASKHLPPKVVYDHVPGSPKAPPGASFKELADAMIVYLHDAQDGKVYETRMPPAYEDDWRRGLINLKMYFYSQHHCPCRRKSDAEAAGAVVEDVDCTGERFLIEKIVFKGLPDLILMSETMDDITLTEILLGKG